jgi:hypothetical protein
MDRVRDTELPTDAGVVRKICQGRGKKFRDEACEYYDPVGKTCKLLAVGPISAVMEHGRCLSKLEIYERASFIQKLYAGELSQEFVDLEELIYGRPSPEGKGPKGLVDQHLSDPSLPALYSYVNRCLYREIMRVFRKRGLIPGRRQCGNCVHLGDTTPRICQLADFVDEKTAKRIHNEFENTEREEHDRACGGYVPLKIFLKPIEPTQATDTEYFQQDQWSNASPAGGNIQQVEDSLDVRKLFESLLLCVQNASPAKKSIHSRRLEDIAGIYRYLRQEGSYKKAKSRLLDIRTGDPKERELYSLKHERDRQKVESCLELEQQCG